MHVNDEMDEICKVLELERWPDLEIGPNGLAAKRRPDIAPPAYDIKISAPLSQDLIKKVVKFANGANPALIVDLYSLCNGLNIGMSGFAVYGVMREFKPGGTIATNSVPFDINIPNLYERPDGWPDDVLIVGVSDSREQKHRGAEVFHCIEPQHRIRVVHATNYQKVLRHYQSVDEWLRSEVGLTLEH